MSKDLKLMVGNYVQLPHFDNYIAQVRTIEIVGIYVSIKGELQFLSHSEYIGVALTPEVLDKCSQFVYSKDRMRFGNLSYYSDCEIPNVIWVHYDGKFLRTIMDLHTLQNLLLLLTNTELIVNF